ncbi:MAG: hypothetical protein RLZZ152_2284, partial [Pseudomonadota bacterium]
MPEKLVEQKTKLLTVKDLHAGYGRAEVLTGLNFTLAKGQ